MRTLGDTLTAAQESPNRIPYLRLTFSKTGESNVVIEQDRILGASGIESDDSQKADFVFQNSTAYFTSLDLKGWTVVIERGLKNAAGTVEYDSMPPMKVVSMDLDSRPGVLRATMSFIGIPNRLNLDKASKNYFNHWSNPKTVKSLLTEVADGDAVDTELTEEQTTHTGNNSTFLYGADHSLGGVALTVPNRTITKLSFRLSKVGTPGGNVTFKISQDAGGSVLESKTIPTSDIAAGSWAWYEVTFDSAQLVDERVWLTCEYSSGDLSNCINFAYNALAVKPDEAFVLLNADDPDQSASPDATWEYPENGGVYRYKYTAGTGVTNGVDCFQHCHDAGHAYEVTYDSEDSLIDSYIPTDGFKIFEGQSRFEVMITLLAFTGCVGIFKADGKFHVFVPTTTGTSYDYEYERGAGNHEFIRKSIRNALVIPNKVTVHSYSDGEVEYSGSATDATSYALLPIDDFRIMNLSSGAQANSIAAAIIAQLQIASQQGSARVPINLGAEIYDYVKVTDSRESDSKTGNIGYISWSYIPGREFSMFFSFGHILVSPITGTPSRPIYAAKKEELLTEEELVQWEQNIKMVDDIEGLIVNGANLQSNTSGGDMLTEEVVDAHIIEQVGQQLGNYLKNLVEDTSPQLGGDLNLNGKNLDFPTTPNISDCLDEDNMVSDSATKLATQQSIKKYVDDKGKTATVDNTTLAKDTNYQNTTGYPLLVIVQWDCAIGGIGYFKTDTNTTPTTVVSSAGGATVAVSVSTVWVVKVSEYYRMAAGGTATIYSSQRIPLGAY